MVKLTQIVSEMGSWDFNTMFTSRTEIAREQAADNIYTYGPPKRAYSIFLQASVADFYDESIKEVKKQESNESIKASLLLKTHSTFKPVLIWMRQFPIAGDGLWTIQLCIFIKHY